MGHFTSSFLLDTTSLQDSFGVLDVNYFSASKCRLFLHSHYAGEKFEKGVFTRAENASNVFGHTIPDNLRVSSLFGSHASERRAAARGLGRGRARPNPLPAARRNLKTQQSAVILGLCLRKTRAGKSRDYCDPILSEKLCFHDVFRPQENTRLRFQISPSWC